MTRTECSYCCNGCDLEHGQVCPQCKRENVSTDEQIQALLDQADYACMDCGRATSHRVDEDGELTPLCTECAMMGTIPINPIDEEDEMEDQGYGPGYLPVIPENAYCAICRDATDRQVKIDDLNTIAICSDSCMQIHDRMCTTGETFDSNMADTD